MARGAESQWHDNGVRRREDHFNNPITDTTLANLKDYVP